MDLVALHFLLPENQGDMMASHFRLQENQADTVACHSLLQVGYDACTWMLGSAAKVLLSAIAPSQTCSSLKSLFMTFIAAGEPGGPVGTPLPPPGEPGGYDGIPLPPPGEPGGYDGVPLPPPGGIRCLYMDAWKCRQSFAVSNCTNSDWLNPEKCIDDFYCCR